MNKKALRNEIKDARKEIEPIIREIKGLVFFVMSLENTKKLSDYFAENIGDMGPEECQAFSKSIIVDYGRLWKKTNNQYIDKLDKSFFPDNAPVHDELIELRDKLVAHADRGFETIEIILGGATVVNDRADPNTHDQVFVPFNTRAEVNGVMWWIRESSTAERIRKHVNDYRELTYKQLEVVSKKLVVKSQKRAHVIKELDELITIREFIEHGERGKRQLGIAEGSLSAKEPKPLKIGRTNLMSTVGIYEARAYPPSEKVSGYGFILEVEKNGDYKVTFPPYQPS